ncbi:MAG: DUF5103 domain-containing protein [Bacteroidia bacterium]|nr:DUF5103 domain-containing protein [Bacteroidia bacterium]
MRIFLTIFILQGFLFPSLALTCENSITGKDTAEYFDENYIRYKDFIYKSNIHTVLLYKEGWELSPPIIDLANPVKLIFSFDDLDADSKSYSYTFIHCDANWQPSDIVTSDYIDGFAENRITDYAYSFNTTFKYTHYSLSFPNDDVKLKISGNYIVKVFDNFDQNNIVLTKRFYVVDHKVAVEATVKQATLLDHRKTSQEVDFKIERKFYAISDPFGELKVALLQNFRWDNAVTTLKPLFVKDEEFSYDYDEDNVFDAGGEFRYFDIKSLRYFSEKVEKISYVNSNYQVKLLDDERRTFKTYLYNKDLNGKYLVKVTEGQNSDIEADYCYVYFTLPYDAPIVDGNIYVFGALSDWDFLKQNQMRYNMERKQYELTLLLKQGYYNYQYVFLKDGCSRGNVSLVEGNHYETENDYIIFVYHRYLSSRYDKLIGYQIVNSVIKNK